MVVAPDGAVAGSVSGGCVEAAVYELATDVVAHRPAPIAALRHQRRRRVRRRADLRRDHRRLRRAGVTRPRFPQLGAVADDIAAHRPMAVATVIAHPDPQRGRAAARHRRARPSTARSGRRAPTTRSPTTPAACSGRAAPRCSTYGPDGERQGAGMEVFVASHAPAAPDDRVRRHRLRGALTRQAAFLGYRVTVCDARPVFATAARFPAADEVVVDWPDRYLRAQVAAGALDSRTAHLRTHPRRQVRRSASSRWRCGCPASATSG